MQNSFPKSGKTAIKGRKLQFVTLNHLNPAQAVWLTGGLWEVGAEIPQRLLSGTKDGNQI